MLQIQIKYNCDQYTLQVNVFSMWKLWCILLKASSHRAKAMPKIFSDVCSFCNLFRRFFDRFFAFVHLLFTLSFGVNRSYRESENVKHWLEINDSQTKNEKALSLQFAVWDEILALIIYITDDESSDIIFVSLLIFINYVRSTKAGDVFSCVCLSVHRGSLSHDTLGENIK